MKSLIRNEYVKLKRLKTVYILLLLCFLPYFINTGGMIIMSGQIDVEQYYFFVFNQNAILYPTLVFIFTGFTLHIEFHNRTTLNWITYPYSTFTLIVAKMITSFSLLLGTALVSHLLHTMTIMAFSARPIDFQSLGNQLFTSLLFSFLTLLMIPVATLLVWITKTFLSVVIIGLGSIFVTTILLGANFGIVFPFAFIYRFTIQFFHSSMGYDHFFLNVGGAIIVAMYVILSMGILYILSLKTRFQQ